MEVNQTSSEIAAVATQVAAPGVVEAAEVTPRKAAALTLANLLVFHAKHNAVQVLSGEEDVVTAITDTLFDTLEGFGMFLGTGS